MLRARPRAPSANDELIGLLAMVAAGLVGDVGRLPRAVEAVGDLARPHAGVPQS